MADKAFFVQLKPLVIQNGDNVAEKWKKWRLRFEIFMDANDLSKVTDSKRTAIFLNAIGDDGIEIFNSLNLDRNTTKLDEILKKFDEKFSPHINVTVERYNFFTRMQKTEESLDEYLTTLNNLATTCEFNNLKEELIKDMLVIGMISTHIKERLLQEENLTVEKAMKIAKSLELSQERSNKLTNQEIKREIVQGIKEQKQNYKNRSRSTHRSQPRYRNNSHRRNNSQGRNQSNNRNKSSDRNCTRCGQIHKYKCPAQDKICNNCKKQGHFAKFCFFRKSDNKVGIISHEQSMSKDLSNNFLVNSIQNSKSTKNWEINVYCNNFKLICQIDTGADTNVISKKTLDKIMSSSHPKINISRTNNKLFSFSGQLVPNLGTCILNCKLENGITSKLYFVVVECECKTILGWNSCEKLGIVKRIYGIQQSRRRSKRSAGGSGTGYVTHEKPPADPVTPTPHHNTSNTTSPHVSTGVTGVLPTTGVGVLRPAGSSGSLLSVSAGASTILANSTSSLDLQQDAAHGGQHHTGASSGRQSQRFPRSKVAPLPPSSGPGEGGAGGPPSVSLMSDHLGPRGGGAGRSGVAWPSATIPARVKKLSWDDAAPDGHHKDRGEEVTDATNPAVAEHMNLTVYF